MAVRGLSHLVLMQASNAARIESSSKIDLGSVRNVALTNQRETLLFALAQLLRKFKGDDHTEKIIEIYEIEISMLPR